MPNSPTRAEEAREVIAELERELGVKGTANVFRKALALAKEAAEAARADGEALDEEIELHCEATARAARAEAEVARLTETLRSQSQECRDAWNEITRLTQERDAAIKVCDMNAMSGGFSARWAENATKRAEAAEARVAVLEEALKPFVEHSRRYADWLRRGISPNPNDEHFEAARAALHGGENDR